MARSTASVRRRARPRPCASARGSASSAARSAFSAARAGGASDRVGPHLSGTDPVHLLGGEHEDLAVADLPGPGRLEDRVDDALDLVLVGHDLDLDLRDEVHLVFGSPVDLGVSQLAAETLRFDGGQAVDADLAERLLHLVEPVRLDDREDQLHLLTPGAPIRSPGYDAAAFFCRVAAFFGAAFFLVAATDCLRASMRSTILVALGSGIVSISSPAIFFSTIWSSASRYSSLSCEGSNSSVRLSMRLLAICTS